METLRPAVGRNSTLTDEARAFILFLPLSNIYCSPTTCTLEIPESA